MQNQAEDKPMTPIDLTTLLDGLDGKWVVLTNNYDKVLHVGKSLDEVLEYSGKGVVFRVEQTDGLYSPLSYENPLH